VFTDSLASNLPGQEEGQRNTQTLTVGEERLKDFRASERCERINPDPFGSGSLRRN